MHPGRNVYSCPSPHAAHAAHAKPLKAKAKCEAVQVVVRCRPMSAKEESQGHTQIIDMWPQRGIVYISNPRKAGNGSGRMFTFDSVYDWNSNQDDLYENTVKPLVHSVLDGYNGTIFAYGQTGTGKTYTMLGSRTGSSREKAEKGITSKCFEDIFRHIAYTSDHTSYVVRASYLEIYQEETRDLLSPDVCKKPLREDVVRGVYVKGLQSVVCKNIKAIERVMRMGNMHRATAATNMNEHSSRSHAIFQITIEMQDKAALARRSKLGLGHHGLRSVRGSGFRVGKLNLVDLAGSERQCKTGAVGERLKESGKINLSLSALGNVISALVDGKSSHIPYRDSKLTQLLQDSLGGNSKSIMIANIGPASYNYDESLMTLRYASRAKHIKNKPTRNVNTFNSVLSHYNKEMRALKKLILAEGGAPRGRVGAMGDARAPRAAASSSTEDSSDGVESVRRRLYPVIWGRRSGPCGGRRMLRPNRRAVWKLHGKYHQETTIKMVRWIQEQMQSRAEGLSHKNERTGTRKESLTEAELGLQRLVDNLSDAVMKEKMLLSIAKISAGSDKHQGVTNSARTFLKLASELNELREHTQKQHRQQCSVLHSEESRLRKELALKNAVFRAFISQSGKGTPDLPHIVTHVESVTDSFSPPTFVL